MPQLNRYPNTAALFHNKNKLFDSQPDYAGEGLIELKNGQLDLHLSAWIKTDRNGDQYLSIAIKARRAMKVLGKRTKKKPLEPKSC